MANLEIIITGENQSSQAFASLKQDLGDVGAKADQAKEKGTGFFSGMLQTAGGFLAANVLGNIAGQMTGFVTDGIAAAQDTAKLMASTQQTIETMGNAAGRSAQDVADMATALSDAAGKSLFGDDQIQQSENLLLTFGNLKGEVFDTATSLTVDLAAALGGAPKDQAMMLGKALNDPIKGISALGKAGLTFSEDQKAAIKAMQESGDMAGAQAIIINELTKQVGGQAEAQAKAAGGMVQFKARMGEVSEAVGAALLPILNRLGAVLSDTVAPVIEAAVEIFGDFVATLEDAGPLSSEFGEEIGWIAEKFGLNADAVEDVVFWIQNLIKSFTEGGAGAGILNGVVTVLGATWNGVLLPALNIVWKVFNNSILPILQEVADWVGKELPPVIATLADYWVNTLMPAITKFWAFVDENVIPIIDTLVKAAFAMLKEDIRILAALWVNVLWPALQKVWQFISANVIPILAQLIIWLKDNLPPAIKFLADLWNNTLLPALNAVWSFIDTKVLPVLKAIGDVINAVLVVAIKLIAGIITNILVPAFEKMGDYISENIVPVLKQIGSLIYDTVAPAFSWLSNQISPLVSFFADLLGNIQGVVDWLEKLADKIKSIKIPAWAGGGGGGGSGGGSTEAPPGTGGPITTPSALRRAQGAIVTASSVNVVVSFNGRGSDLLRQLVRVEVENIMGKSGNLAYNRMRTGG